MGDRETFWTWKRERLACCRVHASFHRDLSGKPFIEEIQQFLTRLSVLKANGK